MLIPLGERVCPAHGRPAPVGTQWAWDVSSSSCGFRESHAAVLPAPRSYLLRDPSLGPEDRDPQVPNASWALLLTGSAAADGSLSECETQHGAPTQVGEGGCGSDPSRPWKHPSLS